jgi:hypothetical protein
MVYLLGSIQFELYGSLTSIGTSGLSNLSVDEYRLLIEASRKRRTINRAGKVGDRETSSTALESSGSHWKSGRNLRTGMRSMVPIVGSLQPQASTKPQKYLTLE